MRVLNISKLFSEWRQSWFPPKPTGIATEQFLILMQDAQELFTAFESTVLLILRQRDKQRRESPQEVRNFKIATEIGAKAVVILTNAEAMDRQVSEESDTLNEELIDLALAADKKVRKEYVVKKLPANFEMLERDPKAPPIHRRIDLPEKDEKAMREVRHVGISASQIIYSIKNALQELTRMHTPYWNSNYVHKNLSSAEYGIKHAIECAQAFIALKEKMQKARI